MEDGGLVLIVPERRLLELNPTALEVLQLLDSATTMEETAAILTQRYEISSGQALQDVRELCNDLLKSGVLVM